MELGELTLEEIVLVESYRLENARQDYMEAFQSRTIATAHSWVQWSNGIGQRLTLSAFVNSFGYQGSDGRKMFVAVQRTFDSAWGF